ncbi:hypothetical protein ACA910_013552 [Epithemia clementina (nom. ined.)]
MVLMGRCCDGRIKDVPLRLPTSLRYLIGGITLLAMARLHMATLDTIWRSQTRWQQVGAQQEFASSSSSKRQNAANSWVINSESDASFTASKADHRMTEEWGNRATTTSPLTAQQNASVFATTPVDPSIQSDITPSTPCSKFAYVFLVGGCNPQKTAGYRGFVFNILVATRMLRLRGATADIVALIQLSQNTPDTQLPDQDVRPLEALGVKVRYLTKETGVEDYYELQFRKFDILSLTEYRRVLYLDGDVMPLGNLDYFFHLSGGDVEENAHNSTSILKRNILLSGLLAPANGGFFLATPHMDRFHQVKDIIRRRKNTFVDGVASFDIVEGWGHVMEPHDPWLARRTEGYNWTFYAASADQGLLYYYFKYVLQDVSIIVDDNHGIQNWGKSSQNSTSNQSNNTNSPRLEATLNFTHVFQNYSNPIMHHALSCGQCLCDFVHFLQKRKPWLQRPTFPTMIRKPYELWWDTLQKLNIELSMGLNITNDWREMSRTPTLGYIPKRVG